MVNFVKYIHHLRNHKGNCNFKHIPMLFAFKMMHIHCTFQLNFSISQSQSEIKLKVYYILVLHKVLRKVLPDLCYDFICWQRLRDFQNIHLDTHGVMKYFSIIKDLIIK